MPGKNDPDPATERFAPPPDLAELTGDPPSPDPWDPPPPRLLTSRPAFQEIDPRGDPSGLPPALGVPEEAPAVPPPPSPRVPNPDGTKAKRRSSIPAQPPIPPVSPKTSEEEAEVIRLRKELEAAVFQAGELQAQLKGARRDREEAQQEAARLREQLNVAMESAARPQREFANATTKPSGGESRPAERGDQDRRSVWSLFATAAALAAGACALLLVGLLLLPPGFFSSGVFSPEKTSEVEAALDCSQVGEVTYEGEDYIVLPLETSATFWVAGWSIDGGHCAQRDQWVTPADLQELRKELREALEKTPPSPSELSAPVEAGDLLLRCNPGWGTLDNC